MNPKIVPYFFPLRRGCGIAKESRDSDSAEHRRCGESYLRDANIPFCFWQGRSPRSAKGTEDQTCSLRLGEPFSYRRFRKKTCEFAGYPQFSEALIIGGKPILVPVGVWKQWITT